MKKLFFKLILLSVLFLFCSIPAEHILETQCSLIILTYIIIMAL